MAQNWLEDYIGFGERENRAALEDSIKRSNEIAAAKEAALEAAREMLLAHAQKRLAWAQGAAFDGDLLDRKESALDFTLARLDALTADPDEDDTRELQAVRDAG